MKTFEEFKNDVVAKSKTANLDCSVLLEQSNAKEDLLRVIKNNIAKLFVSKVLDAEMLTSFFSKKELQLEHIYTGAQKELLGMVVAVSLGGSVIRVGEKAKIIAFNNTVVHADDDSTVEAHDNVSVIANDDATIILNGCSKVEAWGNVNVTALDSSKAHVWDEVTVTAHSNAKVFARGSGACKIVAKDSAIVEVHGNSVVEAYNLASVIARDNTTVLAYDNSTVDAVDSVNIIRR